MLLRFEGVIFNSKIQLIETLLHESNRIIIKIGIGELCNTAQNRTDVIYRLIKVSTYKSDSVFKEYENIYLSLYDEIEKLENVKNKEIPFLQGLLNHCGQFEDKEVI